MDILKDSTPRPWKINTHSYQHKDSLGMGPKAVTIRTTARDFDDWVADVGRTTGHTEQNANACLIVTAVNAFEAMRKALIDARSLFVDEWGTPDELVGEGKEFVEKIDSALKLAEGEV